MENNKELIDGILGSVDLKIDDIVVDSRKHDLVMARGALCCILHMRVGISFSDIGKIIGRDRTTAMYAYDEHSDRMAKSDVYYSYFTRMKEFVDNKFKSGSSFDELHAIPFLISLRGLAVFTYKGDVYP